MITDSWLVVVLLDAQFLVSERSIQLVVFQNYILLTAAHFSLGSYRIVLS